MCMNSVKFALEYDKNARDYVGYGYKRLEDYEYKKYKKWCVADGDWGDVRKDKTINLRNTKVNGNTKKLSYIPGFHIFLNKEDADAYSEYGNTIKVKFRGVLAFGTNETRFGSRDCVIATHMKLVEVCNGNSNTAS